MIPVKGAGLGEVGVLCAWVGGVADECVYPCFVGGEPAGIKVANYGGGVDEVGPVEAFVFGFGVRIYRYVFVLLSPSCFIVFVWGGKGGGGLLTDDRYSKSYRNPLRGHRLRMQQWKPLLPTWYRRLADRFVYL